MIPIQNYENYVVTEYGTVINTNTNRVLTPIINKQNGYPYVGLWKNNKGRTVPIHRLVAVAYIPNPENKPCVNHLDANRTNSHKNNLEWCTARENVVHAYKLGTMIQEKKLSETDLQEALNCFLQGKNMTLVAKKYNCGLSRLSINLRKLAIETNKLDFFVAELKKQKNSRLAIVHVSKQQQINQYLLTGEFVQAHISLNAAAKSLNKKSSGTISNALMGKQNTAYGYLWKYI